MVVLHILAIILVSFLFGGLAGCLFTHFYSIVRRSRRLQKNSADLFVIKNSLRSYFDENMLSQADLKGRRLQLQKFRQNSYNHLDLLDIIELFIDDLKVDLESFTHNCSKQSQSLISEKSNVKKLQEALLEKLESTSFFSREEARVELLNQLKLSVRAENKKWIEHSITEAKKTAREKAVEIVISAMQRYGSAQVNAHSTSHIPLPSEEIKGKIIGKDGRNIKALEMATGMEFIIGEGSSSITISGFNPLRREIAKRSLARLIRDGRINPSSIEEMVKSCEDSIEQEIEQYGRKAIAEFSLEGVHPEMVKLVGRLYFRTSYAQNVWEHSREVAYFARMIAQEMGLDGAIAARAGLFHDIGKALSAEVDGPHALVGAQQAKQYGESDVIVNAIAAHHEETPYESLYGPIITVADALSSARPGARRETLAAYIQRTEKLEDIANTFQGVKKSYVFAAGREVRVIVNEHALDDACSEVLARDIAEKIEKEMSFPGQIKVHVIRESRIVKYVR
jgi:ribonuclease Y